MQKTEYYLILGDLRKEIKTAERVIDHFRKIRNRQDTFEPFEPDGIINDVLALCKRRFEGARIKVKYKNEISGQLTINPAAFKTILTNLLKNAFESILENSNTYDGIISIKLRPSAPGKFCLTVEDSGKGIDDAEESHMFLPFFTTKTPRGMEFGLFGVQRIVSALAGEIKVTKHNKYGGATFDIEIPNSPKPQ